MRPGEVLALRWKDILRDRIVVDERVYDDEFDDVKTDAGKREVPFDRARRHSCGGAANVGEEQEVPQARRPGLCQRRSASRSIGTTCFTVT